MIGTGKNEQQRIDPRSGLIMPWYTHPALDEISTWDLAGKTVLEWGGGESTLWWSHYAKTVWTIESDPIWHHRILGSKPDNVHLFLHDGIDYSIVPDGCHPDIVVVDGSQRTECFERALTLSRPLVIVFDNWQQHGVHYDTRLDELTKDLDIHVYDQPGYTHQHASMWQTAIVRLHDHR